MGSTKWVDEREKDIAAVKSEIDRIQIVQCSKKQAGAENQHQQQCDLADDQPFAPIMIPCATCAARPSFQLCHEVDAGSAKRGHQTEKDGRHDRYGCSETE